MFKRLLELLKPNKQRQPILQQCSVSGSGLRLVKYTSQLYIDCGNLLLKNGFVQTGDYVFTRQNKEFYSKRHFCIYHFYSDGLRLNIYYPSESFILIKNVDDMQKQIDRFNDEYVGTVTA